MPLDHTSRLKKRFAAAPSRLACRHTSTTSPLINSPPQVISLAVYLDEDFVDVEAIAVASILSFQAASIINLEKQQSIIPLEARYGA